MDRRSSTTRCPKVISIPVHFVQSEQTQSASALKIQNAFRGFLVRKSVKQIESIMKEVEAIGKRIVSVMEVGIDEKERLRVNEMLMSLLLNLDSVRGICEGVRECRKRVIRKAVALQDKVDSIPTAVASVSVPASDAKPIASPEQVDSTSKASALDFVRDSGLAVDEEEMRTAALQEQLDATAVASDFDLDQVAADEEAETKVDSTPTASGSVSNQENQVAAVEEERTIHCMITDEEDLAAASKPSLAGCDGDDLRGVDPEEDMEEMRKEEEEEERQMKRRREYLLETMVEENEKLAGMVRELNENKEVQMRLLNSLAQRVEMLEKTAVWDKLARMKKKKKKKQHGGGGGHNC